MNDVLKSFADKNKKLAQQYKEIIEEMLDSGDYRYAETILVNYLYWIDEHGSLSSKQIEAVNNIKAKPSQSYGKYR